MKKISKLSFFYRPDNKKAPQWEVNIKDWLIKNYPSVKIVKDNSEVMLVLGGDGTILEAAKKYQKNNSLIFGMNLGDVGFLASVREPKFFLSALDKLFKGEFEIEERMMVQGTIWRNQKSIFQVSTLNEIAIQSPLGMVEIEVMIENHPIQFIRGTGVLVATPTGSTAFNLSAHGPIVTPDIKAFILTELLDHNIPTPSIVIKKTKKIIFKIKSFRKRGLLTLAKTQEPVDVLLISDGEIAFPLQEKDEIIVEASPDLVRFAQIEPNYFFKSLQEKFGFK